MKFVFMLIAALNLFAGWLPTETNTVDFASMFCFVMAVSCAYCAGEIK